MASHDVEQAANEIIKEIWDDLTDRRYINHELTGCDKRMPREIRNVWRKAIEPRLAAAESDLALALDRIALRAVSDESRDANADLARVTADNRRLVAELYLREDPSAKLAEVCRERDRVTAERDAAIADRDSWKERAERAERARDAASCAWGEAAKRGKTPGGEG